MAVPKRRLSKHRKRTRRAHHHYKKLELNRCTHCGQAILRIASATTADATADGKSIATENF